MSETVESTERDGPLTSRPIPRIGLLQMLSRVLLQGRQDRIDMHAGLRAQYAEHGNIVMADLRAFKMVNLFGPDANRLVLLDQDRIFSARKPWMRIMGRVFPNGLLLLDGDEHKHHRKILHTAFKRPVLRSYAEQMNPIVAAEVEGWRSVGDPFLVFPQIKQLTLDMAARIFVGVDLGPGASRMNEAFESLVAASMSRVRLPIPGLEFHRGLKARQYMVDLIGGLIEEKRAYEQPNLFAHLCHAETDEGQGFTDQQIIDHMSFLMMAAHDTTTSTLTSMMYELARHPEWQERVREESFGYGQDALAFDDLDRFESLTLVFRETLRRYPPLPIIPRIAEESFEFEGHRVPANAMVVVSPIFTHHMHEWWDDPWRFDPERFSPGRAEHERHTHSWIPFGGGPHMCIGLRFAETQVKTVIHHIVRRYRWTVPDGYEMPVQQAPISKPMDDLPVTLHPLA
jgi:cytochrome P450